MIIIFVLAARRQQNLPKVLRTGTDALSTFPLGTSAREQARTAVVLSICNDCLRHCFPRGSLAASDRPSGCRRVAMRILSENVNLDLALQFGMYTS